MHLFLKSAIAVLLLHIGFTGYCQEGPSGHKCAHTKGRTAAKTTVASVAEDKYDVKYVKFDLAADNSSTHLSGNVFTRAKVTASSLSAYVFELNSLLTIDSVLINGTNLTVSTSGSVRTVTLSPALPHDTMFTAQVFYNGTPTSGTLSGALGINSLASPSWSNRATFTLSESYHAYEWWPCKQSLRDKIDSIDMWLTVPDSLKAGSNGILAAVTAIDSHHVRYEWKERSPIDYYLVSLAIANYTDYSYYMHYTGSTDSTLVQNYLYNNSATLPFFKNTIDSTGMMMDYFSTIYGRYPFWKEKYGHSMAPLGGGMEHQTMTTLGFFESTIVAHELGHQWFGDNVTCGTWADIFINEGFASYSEYLFIDHFRSHAGAIADMRDRQTNVKTQPYGAIYVNDTTSEARVFDSRLSYDKGACVLHMLRFAINNDSTFFLSLKTLQQQQKDSTASISDFKDVTKAVAGTTVNSMNLDTFFNQWAYGEGYPIYTASWYQSGSDVMIQLDQTPSFGTSVPLFLTPIEIKLHSGTGDTTVRIFNNQATQQFHFTWSKTMLSMVFDPNYWLLYKMNGITKDPSLLGVSENNIASLRISPNPARLFWQVDNVPSGSSVSLFSIDGKVLWTAENAIGSLKVPAEKLAAGIYFIKVMSEGEVKSFSVVKE